MDDVYLVEGPVFDQVWGLINRRFQIVNYSREIICTLNHSDSWRKMALGILNNDVVICSCETEENKSKIAFLALLEN